MPQHISFPSIEQYRSTIKRVRDNYAHHGKVNLPTLTFHGTVKLHGTNAAIVSDDPENGAIWAQSRSNIIDPVNDNMGFAKWVFETPELRNLLKAALKTWDVTLAQNQYIIVYGEWCGKGVQKGVALNELDQKYFVIFGACVVDKYDTEKAEWFDTMGLLHLSGKFTHPQVRFITDFETYELEIDFNHPEDVQNKLIEITNAVEAECPVAKVIGGVSGTGEGVVWRPSQTSLALNAPTLRYTDLIFKVKGEKHSVSKVKTLAAVDVEKMASIKEFVASVLTEARLEQGFDHLREIGLKRTRENTGVFIKWVCSDVIKEEKDTMQANGFEPKEIMKYISKEAGIWYSVKTA